VGRKSIKETSPMSVKKHDLDKFISKHLSNVNMIKEHVTIVLRAWEAGKKESEAEFAEKNFMVSNYFEYTWRNRKYAMKIEVKVSWITCIIFCLDENNYLKTKVVHVKDTSTEAIFKAVQCDDYLVLYGSRSALCLDLAKVEKAPNFAKISVKSRITDCSTAITDCYYCGKNTLVIVGHDIEAFAKGKGFLQVVRIVKLPDMQLTNQIDLNKWHHVSSIKTDSDGNIVINCTNHEAAKHGSGFYIVGMARYVIDRDSMAVIRKETKT
jgi:hypothetical protein